MAPRRKPENLTDAEVSELAALFVNAEQAAALIGLADAGAVRAYLGRYPDFPRPRLPTGDPNSHRPAAFVHGQYWWIPDLLRWRQDNPARFARDERGDPS